MSLRKRFRDIVSGAPFLDAWFRRLVWSRIHFPESELLLVDRMNKGEIDVAIDVGGALGSYTWPLSRKARRVIVFEPGVVHSHFLAMALAFSNIDLRRCAVADREGTMELLTPGADTDARHMATLSESNPSINRAEAVVTPTKVTTLDAVAKELSAVENVDLLKVDVEGFELAVFEGSQQMLEDHHPIIFCEIEIRHNARYREVFELLEKLGYRAHYGKDLRLEPVGADDIQGLQSEEALQHRLSEAYRPGSGSYINNFIFTHRQSRVNFVS